MYETETDKNLKEYSKIPQNIQSIVNRADRVLSLDHQTKAPGGREGSCELGSEILAFLIRESDIEGLDECKITNLWMLNSVCQGKNYDEVDSIRNKYQEAFFSENPSQHNEAINDMTEALSNSFEHVIVIFKINGEWYLGDTSFCQFIDEETSQVKQSQIGGGESLDNPILKQLYENGVIKITPESLQAISKATSSREWGKNIQPMSDAEELDQIISNIPETNQRFLRTDEETDEIVREQEEPVEKLSA